LQDDYGHFGTTGDLCIRAENGLMESMNENWYRSWCLPGSDGTWGYCRSMKVEDENILHPMSRIPAQDLLLQTPCILTARTGFIVSDPQSSIQCSTNRPIDFSYDRLSIVSHYSYMWNDFETSKDVMHRMEFVARTLAQRHPAKTIVLVSHGGPCTRLYQKIFGNNNKRFGESSYTSFSVYLFGDYHDSWTSMVVNQTPHLV